MKTELPIPLTIREMICTQSLPEKRSAAAYRASDILRAAARNADKVTSDIFAHALAAKKQYYDGF